MKKPSEESDIYIDLKELLFKGFITTKVTFGGVDITFKTINDFERQRIDDRTPISIKDRNIVYDTWFVAYSISQINGINILENRENFLDVIYNFLRKWPRKGLERALVKLLVLRKRHIDAIEMLESFCYEQESRRYWKAYKGLQINSSSLTTIPGTEMLGINVIQREWSRFNVEEDSKDKFEVQWSYIRWLGLFLNTKASQQIEREVQEQKNEELHYREVVKRRARFIYNKRLGKVSEEIEEDDLDIIQYVRNKDSELDKIIREAELVCSGGKDDHELMMDEVKNQTVEEYREYKRQQHKLKIERLERRRHYFNGEEVEEDKLFKKHELEWKSISDQNLFTFQSYSERDMDEDEQKDLLCSSLGISKEIFDQIDKEFEIPPEMYEDITPMRATAKSTILPIDLPPHLQGNYTGHINRGGRPVNNSFEA